MILGHMFEAVARRRRKGRDKLSGIAGKGPKDFTPKHGEIAVKLIALLATSAAEQDHQEAAAIRAEFEGATRHRRRRSRKGR
jgi:hypothetical protein